jgi:hypothetical protein
VGIFFTTSTDVDEVSLQLISSPSGDTAFRCTRRGTCINESCSWDSLSAIRNGTKTVIRLPSKSCLFRISAWTLGWILVLAPYAWATQEHDAPEGLYAHQLAHVFFNIAMGILIYWLRDRDLVRERAWRLIQYSALFFILYSIDAMVVHYLDGMEGLLETTGGGNFFGHIHFLHGPWEFAIVYYIAKMDHLLSLPAIIFLYLGLRQLLKQAKPQVT